MLIEALISQHYTYIRCVLCYILLHYDDAISDCIWVGFDVSKANDYIQKLFANIGKLVCTKIETQEKSVFEITAIESFKRERLILLEASY